MPLRRGGETYVRLPTHAFGADATSKNYCVHWHCGNYTNHDMDYSICTACGAALDLAFFHQAVIMVHHQVRLNLLQGIKHDTHHNQQRSAAKELREILADAEETRKCGEYSNDTEENRSWQSDTGHNRIKIFSSLFAWLDTGNEAVVTLHFFSHLSGAHGNGRVEIGESHNQDEVNEVVQKPLISEKVAKKPVEPSLPPKPASVIGMNMIA